jgi:hypothetical protein
MAIKRAALPKPPPALHFEQVPVDVAKGIAKTAEKKPKVRLALRRSIVRGR